MHPLYTAGPSLIMFGGPPAVNRALGHAALRPTLLQGSFPRLCSDSKANTGSIPSDSIEHPNSCVSVLSLTTAVCISTSFPVPNTKGIGNSSEISYVSASLAGVGV